MSKEMKGLKLSELKENTIYQCELSGNKILIVSNTISKYKIPNSDDIECNVVYGTYYEKHTGCYATALIFENQLTELGNF